MGLADLLILEKKDAFADNTSEYLMLCSQASSSFNNNKFGCSTASV